MTLSNAFTAAWKDLKTASQKVAAFLSSNGPALQTAVLDASAVVAAVAPAVAPVVSEFDALEEAIVGKVAALAQDTTTAPTMATLFAEEWPALQSLIGILKNHPTVTAVTANLTGTKAGSAAAGAAS